MASRITPDQMLGRTFNRLTVKSETDRHDYWLCRCECGTEKVVHGPKLRTSWTRSCGCLRVEANHRLDAPWNVKHGMSKAGGNPHPLYGTWTAMRGRCNNPNDQAYADYGGRGIQIDERWNDFVQFITDMGPKPTPAHTIDRINNNGPYSPENCRWATKAEQTLNQRPRGTGHKALGKSR